MKTELKNGDYYIESYGKKIKIIEVWESFTGWYWFITEFDKHDPRYAYGLVRGLETEWGSIWMPELEKLGKYKVWKVNKTNWIGLPDIVKVLHK